MLTLEPTQRSQLLQRGSVRARDFDRWIDECRAITLEDPDRGLDISKQLVSLSDEFSDARIRARALSARCHALSYSGEMREAMKVSQEARELAAHSIDQAAFAEALLTSVQSHNVLGKRDEALAFASEAGAIFSDLGDSNRSATCIMLAGVVLRMLDKPAEALTRFDAALSTPDLNESLSAQLASNRAEALLDLGRFEEARTSFENALAGFTSCGMSFGVAIVEGNLADLASRRGELREALGLFRRASRRFRDADDHAEAARLDAEAAELLLTIGDAREALQRLPGAMVTLHKHGLQTEFARARMTLGVALGRSGRTDEAIQEIESARQLCIEHNQTEIAARAESLMGGMLIVARRFDEAIGVLAHAIETCTLQPQRARLLLELCYAQVKLEQYDQASETLEQASTLIDELGLADLDSERSACKIAIASKDECPEAAHEIINEAFEALDVSRNQFSGDRLRSAMIGSSARLFNEAMRCAVKSNDAHLALEISERVNARSLTEQSADSSAVTSPEIASHEGDISATLHQIETARAEGSPESDLQPLRERVTQLQRAISKLELHEPAENALRQTALMGAETLIRSVPSDTTAVSFARVDDTIIRVTIQNDDADMSKCDLEMSDATQLIDAALGNIDRTLARLTLGRPVSERLRAELNKALEELGTGIFGDTLTEDNNPSRLVIVLPRELSRLPVACLRIQGRSLVEYSAPVVAPSLVWAATSSPSPSQRDKIVIAGVSDEYAPDIDNEIEQVSATTLGCTTLSGPAATMGALERTSRDARILHLACHAEYTPEDPMGSRLKLADGWISARRLAELDLGGAQVVLSGCETGSVDAAHAGEHFGLVRSVLLAGARRVIASRWRLSDRTASELFASLYVSMNDSDGGDANLDSILASLQSKRSQSGEHPALWGGLFAVGSWK